MAQAAESLSPQAAQREPSMEEILASIRRIIEDSDTARGPDVEPMPVAANAPLAREVERFRSELSAAPAVEMDDDEADALVLPVRASENVAAPVSPVDEIDFEDSLMLGDDLVAANNSSAPQASASIQAGPVAAAAQQAPPASSPPAASALPSAVPAQRSTILSEVAGRQVAAAFNELSDAFAASRRRSFDEIAEEMMRPMLQDWLDNNLPTLVEKLVREEIERVARGPAR